MNLQNHHFLQYCSPFFLFCLSLLFDKTFFCWKVRLRSLPLISLIHAGLASQVFSKDFFFFSFFIFFKVGGTYALSITPLMRNWCSKEDKKDHVRYMLLHTYIAKTTHKQHFRVANQADVNLQLRCISFQFNSNSSLEDQSNSANGQCAQ